MAIKAMMLVRNPKPIASFRFVRGAQQIRGGMMDRKGVLAENKTKKKVLI